MLTKIGSYRIQRELGRGGFAVVYLAYDDERRKHEVALKVLRQDLDDSTAVQRFQREGEQLLRWRHQHIVGAYEAGRVDGQYVIAMPYMTGGSLESVLASGRRLDLPAATRIVEQVASALDFVHPGLIHRDLKPANILFDAHGNALVADLGIAHVADASTLTGVGALAGSIHNMAPEQIKSSLGALSPATDVWALGVVLYEMLCGRKPFDAENWQAVLYQIVNEEPSRPTALNPSLSPQVDAILLRALAKDPRQRYQAAGQLADDLRRLVGASDDRLERKAVQPEPERSRTPSGGKRATTAARVAKRAPPGNPPRRKPLWPLWIFGGVAVLAVVIFLFARSAPPAAPASTPVVGAATVERAQPTLRITGAPEESEAVATVRLARTQNPTTVVTRESALTPVAAEVSGAASVDPAPAAAATQPLPKPDFSPLVTPLPGPALFRPLMNETANARVLLEWQPSPGAARYEVLTCSDREGQRDWRSWGEVTDTRFEIYFESDPGYFSIPGTLYYWQIVAADSSGVHRTGSEVRAFVFQRGSSDASEVPTEPTPQPLPSPLSVDK